MERRFIRPLRSASSGQTAQAEAKTERKPEQEGKKESPASGKPAKANAKPEGEGKKESPAADKPAKADAKPEPEGKKESPADKKPEQDEKKQPVPENQPAAEEAPRPDEKKPAPAEKKIAPSHRERMEIIRKAISEQIAAHEGRIKSGELFKTLSNLPDYKFDQQRSNRNPQDYLVKQYSAWFVFEAGEKGSFWISERDPEAGQTSTAENPAPESPAPPAVPVPEPTEQTAGQAEQPAAASEAAEGSSPAQSPEASFIAAGVPEKDAARAAAILPKCRNMRDVYNRMRGAFGKDAGKTYYEIVKGMVQSSVYSFPPRAQNAARPAEKDDQVQTKEEAPETPAAPADEPAPASPEDGAEDAAAAPDDGSGEHEGGTETVPADGAVRYLLDKGVAEGDAVRIVAIFTGSANRRVAYNKLRREFGNKGGLYLKMIKEYYKEA